jgi:hypothetical protein
MPNGHAEDLLDHGVVGGNVLKALKTTWLGRTLFVLTQAQLDYAGAHLANCLGSLHQTRFGRELIFRPEGLGANDVVIGIKVRQRRWSRICHCRTASLLLNSSASYQARPKCGGGAPSQEFAAIKCVVVLNHLPAVVRIASPCRVTGPSIPEASKGESFA